MAFVELTAVTKTYGPIAVLDSLDLSVDQHEVVCLIGPSGCGKSTMLRCINGLEPIRRRNDPRRRSRGVEPYRRYQCGPAHGGHGVPAVQPVSAHDRAEKCELAQRRSLRIPKSDAEEKGARLLNRVGLGDKMGKYPDALSGGEQQRVAIARALAVRPDVLLLDEITSALDPELVGEVLSIVEELASDGMTMILATHEMSFARDVATRIGFVAEGQIHEQGPPDQILSRLMKPKTQAFLRRLMESHRL